MEKTIFEKIIENGNAEGNNFIFQDEYCAAFLDIAPVKKGHTLLISKNPYPWIQDVPDSELQHIMLVAKRIIQSMKNANLADYVQLTVMGTEVPHFHIHLIPHAFSDLVETSHQRPVDNYTSQEEKESYISKIKNSL